MSALTQAITLPLKPRFNTPCNGCGLCCSLEICEAGIMAYPGAQAPCPGLKIAASGTRTYCELVAREIESGLEPMLQRALGIGFGCSMMDDDTTNEQWDEQTRSWLFLGNLDLLPSRTAGAAEQRVEELREGVV